MICNGKSKTTAALVLISYFFKKQKQIQLISVFLLFRFVKERRYLYMFFFRKSMFFLPFGRFRLKKIKKFRVLVKSLVCKKISKQQKTKQLIFWKKNSSTLSLKKKLLRKSLYNNKFFNSRFFYKFKQAQTKTRNLQKKKSLHSLSKFFSKYISNERSFFLKMFGLKNKIQKSTTRLILPINKTTPLTYKRFLELSLLNVLMRTKFCLSKNHASVLLDNNSVYVNFKLVKCRRLVVNVYDTIQVIFCRSAFYLYKYSYNLIFKRLTKLNYCIWRIQNSKKRINKQHIQSLPSWLQLIFFYPYATPKYLEVDFTSLTTVILSNPTNQKDFSPYIYWNFNYFLYKLLAWKWIT